MKNILAELAEFKKIFVYFFSFEGRFSRSSFVAGLFFASFVCSLSKLLTLGVYEPIGWFLYLYLVLISFEKRCRDLRIQGFGITLIVTAFNASLIPWVDKTVPDCFPLFSDVIFYVYIVLVIFMASLPGKNDEKKTPLNPLLKYPKVYLAVCFIAYIVGKNFIIQTCGTGL